MKISDIKVGAKFQYRDSDLLIEINRVLDDTVSFTVIGAMDDASDAILDHFVTSLLRNSVPVVTNANTSKRKIKRKYMLSRRSNTVIEVKKVTGSEATIVNVDDHWKPIAGTERKIERDSLIKSYTPVDR